MKSILQFPIVALLLIAPAMISAFTSTTPAVRSIGVFNPSPTNNNNFARLSVRVGMAEKAAKSKEEDLELTRSIIMSHIASSDDLVMDDGDDDNGDDDDESPSSSSPVSKIKSAGKKIKDKVKSKLSKD